MNDEITRIFDATEQNVLHILTAKADDDGVVQISYDDISTELEYGGASFDDIMQSLLFKEKINITLNSDRTYDIKISQYNIAEITWGCHVCG